MFAEVAAEPVFQEYEERRKNDEARMKQLGPQGFAMRDEFLLPVGPDVARFLHSLIIAHRPKVIVEFGTSYGYSTLFLADAAATVGARVITFELAEYKQEFARQKLGKASLDQFVDFQLGDAVELASNIDHNIDFCLIDIWKELYVPCFELAYPRLSDGAIVAADNMIFPDMARPDVRLYRKAVKEKADMQSTLLPIGAGLELSTKWSATSKSL